MEQQQLQHLYWRAGFGINPVEVKRIANRKKKIIDDLFEASNTIKDLTLDISYLKGINPKDLKGNPTLVKSIREYNAKKTKEYNYLWIDRLATSSQILREKMTLFWANHFVCKDNNILYVQNYNNTLRRHALGDFREFVKAISKEAAMLRYLNGRQNRKQKPNENFARELMELFTLGEGHYSETDIKESARAFTGYNFDYNGEFRLRKFHHDVGQKRFFGKIGNFTGDDIVDIILENKQCAYFVSDKIYRFFVNPNPNEAHIKSMANVFYKDYNIDNLIRFVFMSDWFYDEVNIGSKIKSPIELLIGISKTVSVKFEKNKDLLKIQRLLGQTLLNPPNVAGWKQDKAWIDANTIMIRLKLPSLLLNNAFISLKKQGDFNDSFREKYFKRNLKKVPFKTLPDWDGFYEDFKFVNNEDLDQYIIQGIINKGTRGYLKTLSKKSKKDHCIQLMSLPEYQMC